MFILDIKFSFFHIQARAVDNDIVPRFSVTRGVMCVYDIFKSIMLHTIKASGTNSVAACFTRPSTSRWFYSIMEFFLHRG